MITKEKVLEHGRELSYDIPFNVTLGPSYLEGFAACLELLGDVLDESINEANSARRNSGRFRELIKDLERKVGK